MKCILKLIGVRNTPTKIPAFWLVQIIVAVSNIVTIVHKETLGEEKMHEHEPGKSNAEDADQDIESFYEKLKAERDFHEAIDILNTLLGGSAATQRFKMMDENEVVLMEIANNEVIRKMHRDEILAISKSLKKLLNSHMQQ